MLPDAIRRAALRLDARLRPRPAYLPLSPHHAVAVTDRGFRLLVRADDLSLTPALALHGRWEGGVAALLRALLRPGDRVAEGGANVGYHTLGMAERIGPEGRLDAFEPVPDFLPMLEWSLAENRLAGRVRLHDAALLDRAGPIEILQDPQFQGSGHLAIPHASPRYARRIAARATTLDAALAGPDGAVPPLDLLRLDVEGAEIMALRGAERVLRASPRLRILMEWSPVMLRAYGDPAGGAAWLAETHGFRAWRVLPRRRPGLPFARRFALSPVAPAEMAGLPHGEVLLARGEDPFRGAAA